MQDNWLLRGGPMYQDGPIDSHVSTSFRRRNMFPPCLLRRSRHFHLWTAPTLLPPMCRNSFIVKQLFYDCFNRYLHISQSCVRKLHQWRTPSFTWTPVVFMNFLLLFSDSSLPEFRDEIDIFTLRSDATMSHEILEKGNHRHVDFKSDFNKIHANSRVLPSDKEYLPCSSK